MFLSANSFIKDQYNKNLLNIEKMQGNNKKHEKRSEMFDPNKLVRSESLIFKFDDGKMGISPEDRRTHKFWLVLLMFWFSLYAYLSSCLIYFAIEIRYFRNEKIFKKSFHFWVLIAFASGMFLLAIFKMGFYFYRYRIWKNHYDPINHMLVCRIKTIFIINVLEAIQFSIAILI